MNPLEKQAVRDDILTRARNLERYPFESAAREAGDAR
jgi:hypothetical protein